MTPSKPRKVQSRKARDTAADVLGAIKDKSLEIERALAGYYTLTGALNTHVGQVPEGERPKGLMPFSYAGTLDGVHAMELVADLQEVDPEHVPSVLVPLINACIKKLWAAGAGLRKAADRLENFINNLVPTDPVAAEDPVDAGEGAPEYPEE